MDKIDGHIYYDVLYNNTLTIPQKAYFYEARTQNLLDVGCYYHLSVVRFTIPTFSIPLFLYKTVNNDGVTPNNSYYSFTFIFGGISYTSFLTYQKWTTSPLPGIYCYQNWIDTCNIALRNGHEYMTIHAVSYPASCPPYFIYNASTQVISLIADKTYFCNTLPTTGIQLYSNFVLHKFYESIAHIEISTNSPIGADALFVIESTGNNDTVTNYPVWLGTYPSVSAYQMDAQYQVLQNWSSLKSIVFTSMNLCTRQESVQNPYTINTNSQISIITDFEPERSELASNRSWEQYSAKIYRFIDIITTSAIKEIDISVYWSSLDGLLYPIYINPGEYFSMKILFKRKDLVL